MVSILSTILCYIENAPTILVTGIVDTVNLVISAVGLLILGMIAILPSMPTGSTSFMPTNILSAANWFYPFGMLVTAISAAVALYVAYLAIKIILNWLKVIGV